jgi:hypothetical protein
MLRGSNPAGGEIFRIRPEPPRSCYTEGSVTFRGEVRGVDHQFPYSAEVKERVELTSTARLCLYSMS